MIGGQRRGRETVNIWPGFVDALATVLLAFIFLILLFVVAQFYLSDILSARNTALERLEQEVQELGETLAMERDKRKRVEEQLSETYSRLSESLAKQEELQNTLATSRERAQELKSELAASREEIEANKETLKMRLKEIASLQADIDTLRRTRDKLESRVGELSAKLASKDESLAQSEQQLGQLRDRTKALKAQLADQRERTQLAQEEIDKKDFRIRRLATQVAERSEALSEQKELTEQAQARVQQLREDVQSLRDEVASLSEALELSREKVSSQRAEIKNLGERLNKALADKVRELSKYRSEFFGRLREVLGDVDELRIVGDRFMFQSELFFESGKAQIGRDGRQKLNRLASILEEIGGQIPEDVPWVLQVEGHTDKRPINTERFPSNWELSTARATNIVHYLVDRGIPPDRLAAVGYGPYQPIAEGETQQAYARNRRIEMRLTNR